MSKNTRDFDAILDESLEEMRDQRMDDATEQASFDRVWARVREEAVQASAEAEDERKRQEAAEVAEVPSIQKAHDDAKRWLYQDSLSETVSRGRAVQQRESTGRKSRRSASFAAWGWRVAAAAAMVILVVGVSFKSDLLTIRTGGLIHIQMLEGPAFIKDANGSTRVVQPGEQLELGPNERLMTGKDGQMMLTMEDGSQVEVAPRSVLTVYNQRPFWRGRNDGVVGLDRGNVIVEASDQGSGHLYVDTPDAMVTVTGTVFAVNTGMKGSRVSVIEGSVNVEQDRGKDSLVPGQQVTTSPSLRPVPITEEISWSQNFKNHLNTLRAAAEFADEIDRLIAGNLRTSTDLLEQTPANAVVYIGAPNLARVADEAYGVLEEKIGSSPELQQWWDENMVSEGHADELAEAMRKIGLLGDQLGDEIVFAVMANAANEPSGVVAIADASSPTGLRNAVENLMADNAEGSGIWLDGSSPDTSALIGYDSDGDTAFWWTHDGMIHVTPNAWVMQDVIAQATTRSIQAGSFRARLADQYADGAEWVIGVDLGSLMAKGIKDEDPEDIDILAELGLFDAEYLVGEQRTVAGHTEGRLTLDFNRPRRGLVAWLDNPAPIGAMQYISQDAIVAGGFAMQEPEVLVNQLFTVLKKTNEDFDDNLAEFERESGINVLEDLAAPLGGEFAFALEYPLVPNPNYKLIMQVYDEPGMQRAIEWAVEQANTAMGETDLPGGGDLLQLTTADAFGRTYYKIENPLTTMGVHYLYHDGYMIAGSSRVQLDNAISTAEAGLSLDKSAGFRALLPQDRENNFSGVLYQNVGGALEKFAWLASQLSQDEAFAKGMEAASKPSLTVAYGDEQSLTFVYRREGGLFGGTIRSFFTLETLMDLERWSPTGVGSAAVGGDADGPVLLARMRNTGTASADRQID